MHVNSEVAQSSAIPPDDNPVRQEWDNLLCDRLWHWFGTHTYRTNIKDASKVEKDVRDWVFLTVAKHLEGVRPELVQAVPQQRWSQVHRRWYTHICYQGKFPRAYRKLRAWCSPQWALGIEEHDSGYLHAHSIVWLPPALECMWRKDAWRLWFDKHGSARVKPPEVNKAVASYVAKYATKDGVIKLSENFNRLSRN